jgi:mannose/fructose/N-acetylgalactosamine-specific phosphotransferase system component IIC
VGNGDHDPDDEEPGPLADSTSAAGERDAGEGEAHSATLLAWHEASSRPSQAALWAIPLAVAVSLLLMLVWLVVLVLTSNS